ncbi:putative tail protein [Rhizobium phage RHph_X3_2]|nr:putative tail protein [Rhizobium phage RHph_X3_2]
MLYFIFALLAFFLLDSGAAQAGPLIGAIVAIGNVLGGLGIVGKILLTVGLAIGQTLLQKALAKKNKPQDQIQGADLEIKMGDDLPVSTTLGTYATAGKRKYIGAWGKDGKTPNAFLVDVIELGNLPVGALVELWINDKKCTLETTSPHPDGLGYPIDEFTSDGKVYGWWKFYDGTQTVADDYLIAKFGSHATRPWINTMIGRGVPYIILTYRLNQKLYSNSLPSATVVTRGAKLYDIRKDSTAGGSGAHRWDDPSTWESSDNPFVQAYNIARGLSYDGKWFYGGQNVSTKRLPSSGWIAAMNACDALRSLDGGGTEKMFRSGIELKGENEPLAIIEYLRSAANGRIVEIGGKLKPFAGPLGAAEAAFTDGDIIITEGQTFEPFPILDDIFNGATATYPEPLEKWASKDAPPYYVEDLEEEDGDRRLVAALQFPAAPYPVQVQALMRTAVEEARRFRTHQFWLPPAYWGLEPGDVVTWTSNINGYDDKKFLVLSCEGELTYNQLVTLREVDPADYDWSPTFQKPVVVGPVGPVVLPSQFIPGWSVNASSFSDDTDTPRRPAIAIAADSEIDDLRAIKIQIVHTASGELVHTSELPYVVEEDYQWTITGSFLFPGEEYSVRGIQVPFGTQRVVDWTPWIDVTMFPLAFSTRDVLDDAITAAKIQTAAVTADKIMNAAINELKLADAAVSTAKIQLAAVTSTILANNSVIASKIADGAVNTAKFATGIEPVTISTAGTLPTTKSTENIVWQGDLYTWNGTAYEKPTPGPGSITSTEIADNSITTPKLTANAVTADKVAANAIVAGKIAAGAVSATEIAAQAITASKLFLGDTTNVFPDYNMLDPDFYSSPTSATYQFVGTSSSDLGQKYLQITGPAGAVEEVVSGWFALEKVGEYYITASAFQASGSSGLTSIALIEFGSLSSGGVVTPTRRVEIGQRTDSTTTTKFSIAEANTSSERRARFVFQRSAAGTGVCSFGGPQVRLKSTGELIVDGTITAVKIAADTITATQIAAGAITATELATNSVTAIKIAAGTITGDKIAANTIGASQIAADAITAKHIVVTDFENLVANGYNNIEVAVTDVWVAGSGATIGYSSNALTGNRSMFLQKATLTDSVYVDMLADKMFAVTQGDILYGEVAVDTNVTTTAGFYFRVYWYDANKVALASPTLNDFVSNAAVSTSWSTFKANVTVPAGARFAAVRFYNHSTNTVASTFYIDRVIIRRMRGAELIVDGTITADHLAANTITAAKIAVGTITADRIVLNGITTDRLAPECVTDAAGARTAAAIAVPANTETQIQSVVVTGTSGSFAQLIGSFLVDTINISTSSNGTLIYIPITITIYRGGTLIHTINSRLPMTGYKWDTGGNVDWHVDNTYFGGLIPVIAKDDTPAVGSQTYSLRVESDRALSVLQRHWFASIVKR